jgi:hypothetical protein
MVAHTETKKNGKLDYRHEILSESGLTPETKNRRKNILHGCLTRGNPSNAPL